MSYKNIFDTGIIRTGNSISSIIPEKNVVLKLINSNELSRIRAIKKIINRIINRKCSIQMILPVRVVDKVGKYVVDEEVFVNGKKIIPSEKNLYFLLKEVTKFVECLLKNKIYFYSKNFNYGNMIFSKELEKIVIIGIRDFKKGNPLLNFISFCDSLYWYFEKETVIKIKILEIMYNVLKEIGAKYNIKIRSILKKYIDNPSLYSSPEFRFKIKIKQGFQ